LTEALVSPVADAPDSLPPIDAVGEGLVAAAALLQQREAAAAERQGLAPGEFARLRQRIIGASPELRERELIKLASLAGALAEALRDRGLDDSAASILAEIAIAVFRISYERSIEAADDRDLPELIREALGQLELLAAPTAR
jgi:hypothetical protein